MRGVVLEYIRLAISGGTPMSHQFIPSFYFPQSFPEIGIYLLHRDNFDGLLRV